MTDWLIAGGLAAVIAASVAWLLTREHYRRAAQRARLWYEDNNQGHAGVLAALDGYIAHTGSPGAYVVASWFPYPDRTVPVITDLIPVLRRRF